MQLSCSVGVSSDMRQDIKKELEQGKRDYERNFLPERRSPVLEWIGDFWRGLLESNVVGLTGPKSRNYWAAKIISLLLFVVLMLMILYCTLRTS